MKMLISDWSVVIEGVIAHTDTHQIQKKDRGPGTTVSGDYIIATVSRCGECVSIIVTSVEFICIQIKVMAQQYVEAA